MKRIILLLCLMSFAPVVIHAGGHKHKSEAEIVQMTPAQRVDEWVNEDVHRGYDFSEHLYWLLMKKYILRDGLALLPRMIEIMDEYDPTRGSGRSGHKGERFDAVLALLDILDNEVVRLRGTAEGRRAVDALERAVNRMRIAGYSQQDEVKWSKYERFDFTSLNLGWIKGISQVDENVKDTLWVRYKILLSKEELLAFSNFLIARDPTYPSWSETDFMKDYTRINEAGNPLRVYIMKKPERFYEAYLKFKKTQP
jgi:hypothetical protein